jgi:hypothetical protein
MDVVEASAVAGIDAHADVDGGVCFGTGQSCKLSAMTILDIDNGMCFSILGSFCFCLFRVVV